MFNMDKMNNLMREVESLSREHAKATAKRNAIIKDAGEAVVRGLAFDLECKTNDLADVDFTIKWTKERLEEVKAQMISLVNGISFWEE